MTKTKSQKKRANQQRAQRKKAVTKVRSKVINRINIPKRQLSECAQMYVRSLQNPFLQLPACVPSTFNTPTLKQSFRATGTFSTGTQGVGGIVVNPYSFVYNNATSLTGTSLSPGFLYSNAAYTYTVLPIFSSTTGLETGSSNSTYQTPNSSLDYKFRLVSCGLRVKNITAQLSRGGQLAMCETPQHSDLSGSNIVNFMNYDTAEYCNVNGGWNSVCYHPIEPEELEFYNFNDLAINNYLFNDGAEGQLLPHNFMAAFVIAPTGSPQVYQFEIVGNYECVGRLVHGLTVSHSDPVGMAAAQEATGTTSERKPKQSPAEETTLRKTQAIWESMVGASAPIVGGGLATYGSQVLVNRYRNNRDSHIL